MSSKLISLLRDTSNGGVKTLDQVCIEARAAMMNALTELEKSNAESVRNTYNKSVDKYYKCVDREMGANYGSIKVFNQTRGRGQEDKSSGPFKLGLCFNLALSAEY